MDIRFKNTESYIKSFAETKLVRYFLESYQASRVRPEEGSYVQGKINERVESSGEGGNSLNVKVENGGLNINLYGNRYLEDVDKGTQAVNVDLNNIVSWIKTKPVTLKDLSTGEEIPRNQANIRFVARKIVNTLSLEGIKPARYIGEVVEKAFENIVDGMLPPLKEDVKDKLDDILTSVGYTKQGDTYVFKGR
jgi:hypothetical protein